MNRKGKGLQFVELSPDKCQICGISHKPDQPHNRDSLRYQMWYCNEHPGKSPTWDDAMAHCTKETKKIWKEELVKRIIP